MNAAPEGLLARYGERLESAIDAIVRDEADHVRVAATLVADQVRQDGLVHVYGPGGHSALAVQDVFYRAGCPIAVAPVADPATALFAGALGSTAAEREADHGEAVVAGSGVGQGALFVVVNAFGVNAAAVGAARAARARGARVIALSSRAAEAAVPAGHRARSGSLPAHADVHVDTHVPAGDVVLEAGPGVRVGGLSTVLNSFVLHAILASAVEQLVAGGDEAWVWHSSYTAGGDAHNARAAERVRERVPQL
ncbi:sugar isomerase domain-containing protein [Amycolatopsis mongoliensis]|uniref:Sugar isomerase domain-containing protein n=1 Tax=Amycolatopsis mongoliensis TaxID=715475 RepID=A0A9Y2JMW1_9PSEU|nr:sugar isomerase domain-containing protein [Amycolatopsis sp. 4-36]WIY00953.1 sugar isomerase domain-containing protein [Amycolatopsis sp. 4-36]